MPKRWGILGAGNISFSHATALTRSPHADFVGVADIDASARERAGTTFDVPAFASIEDLLDRAAPDAVTIALPASLHLSAARTCAARGVHVLCEKPLAATVTECDEMMRVCDDARVHLGAILNTRGYEQGRWVRARIRDGSLRVRAFSLTLALAGPTVRSDPGASAMLMLGAGIHYLDLLAWWFGELTDVAAVPSRNDVSAVALAFASGVSGVFRLSSAGAHGRPARIDLDAEEGHVAFIGSAIAEATVGIGPVPPPPEAVDGMRFGTGHLVVIDEAARALAQGRPFPVSGKEGRDAVALVERVVAATRAPTAVA